MPVSQQRKQRETEPTNGAADRGKQVDTEGADYYAVCAPLWMAHWEKHLNREPKSPVDYILAASLKAPGF